METNALAFLQMMQLADSALPIGTAAHSYGLETLVEQRWLRVEELEVFFRAYLEEAGVLESAYCLRGYQGGEEASRARETALEHWLELNAQMSAYATARESREASAALGRRLLQLAMGLEVHPFLGEVARA